MLLFNKDTIGKIQIAFPVESSIKERYEYHYS